MADAPTPNPCPADVVTDWFTEHVARRKEYRGQRLAKTLFAALDAAGWEIVRKGSTVTIDEQGAIKAQLRQLDRIKAALPPVDMIRRMATSCRNVQDQGRPKNVEWFDWVPADLDRLADALEDPDADT